MIKPSPPPNLKIRYKKAWRENPPAPFAHLTAMLRCSGISQKTGCGKETWVSYTLDNRYLSHQGLIVLAGGCITSPQKAEILVQRCSLPFTIVGSTCRFTCFFFFFFGRVSILLPKIKTIRSYCTTNRSSHATNAHVCPGCPWLLLLDVSPVTPFASARHQDLPKDTA